MEVVASLSQGRTASAQCGLFTHKSVPVIFEPPCTTKQHVSYSVFTGDNSVPFQTSFVIHALAIQLLFWCSYLKNVGSNDVNITSVLGT